MADSAFEWFRELRTLLYDAYWPPFHPKLDFEPERGVAVAKETGANAIRFGCVGKSALFQSRVMPVHPGLNGRDLLDETLVAAKRENIKLVAYIPVGHGLPGVMIEKERPQWAYVLDDGRSPKGSLHFGGPAVVPVCVFGPYGRDVMEMAREIVARDIDALYVDGPYHSWIFEGTICQCEACKRLFFERFGEALPTNAELAVPAAARSPELSRRLALHKTFVADKLASLMKELGALAASKRLPLLFNSCAMEYLGAERQASLLEFASGFLVESSLGGIKGIGKGLRHDKIVWSYTRRHSCWPRVSEPEDETSDLVSGLLSVAQGATPIVSYAGRFLYEGSCRGPVSKLFSFMKSWAPALRGARPASFCAIVCPSGLNAPGSDGKPHPDDEATLAAFELLRSAGIQCAAMPRDLLSDPAALREFAAVFLPSFNSLDAQELETLSSFARSGGCVMATGRAWAVEPSCVKAAKELFGVEPLAPSGEFASLISNFRWDQANSAPYDCYLRCVDGVFPGSARFSKRLMPLCEFAPVKLDAGSSLLAEIALGGDFQGRLPGLIEKRSGQGGSLFSPFSLELAWRASGNANLRELLASSLARLLKRTPPLSVDSAPGLFANVFMTPRASALVCLVDADASREAVSAGFSFVAPAGRRIVSAKRLSNGASVPFSCDGERAVFSSLKIERAECFELQFQ